MKDEIDKWASLQDWQHAQAVIGLGLSENEYFRDTVFRCRPGAKLFIYEPGKKRSRPEDKVFISSTHQELRADIIDNIGLIGNFVFARDPKFQGDIEQEILGVVNEARQYYTTMQHTSRFHAMDWAEIGFEILPKLAGIPLLNFFPEIFKGKPGIIVGAGPSLDKALDALKAIQDKVVIFASNSAAIPLYNAGIQPHFICAIEKKSLSIDPILDHPVTRNSYIVPGIHSYPPTYDIKCKMVLPAIQMVGPVGQWLCSQFHINPVHTGGSVSTVAFRVADLLGCDPIVLIGCDCAQGPSNESVYASGVAHETNGYKEMDSFKVTAWGGIGFVQAPQVLNTYRHWFENRVDEKRSRLINASIGGARIEGWDELEIKDLDVGDSIDVDGSIGAVIDSIPRLPVDGLKAGLNDQLEESSRFALMARQALKAAKQFDSALRAIVTTKHKFNITMGCAVSQIPELMNLPREDQIRAVMDKMTRVNLCHKKNNEQIARILKGFDNASISS